MEEEKIALVEKIIKDIHVVLSKIDTLATFEFVPVDTNFRNKSPVLHLANCFGLETWCLKHVYMYCYSEIMDRYCPKEKHKVFKFTSQDSDRMVQLLNVTLLINPELSFLWNKRRILVQESYLNKAIELDFAGLILTRKPKCNDAFAYRRWLLDDIIRDEILQSNNIEELVDREFFICTQASLRNRYNYHSWNHRMWLMKKLKSLEGQYDVFSQYIKEFNFSVQWAVKNISDYSCYHYYQFCVKNIYSLDDRSWKTFEISISVNLRYILVRFLVGNFPKDSTVRISSNDDWLSYSEENLLGLLLSHTVKKCHCKLEGISTCRKIEFIFKEFVLNTENIRFYNHHETLWYHRRFLIREIMGIFYEYFSLTKNNGVLIRNICKQCSYDEGRQKQAKTSGYDSNLIYSSFLFKALLIHEAKFINLMKSKSDNYADRHEKYLKFVEGFNCVL